jgi:hypothetical protein
LTVDGRVLALLGAAAFTLVALWFFPPIAQDQAYHRLADSRAFFGIPNFWNVVSNIPFLLIGAAGLRLAGPPSMKAIFLGVFLVGFGSSYYHWAPSDGTLLWDRLPITLGFMAILANIIEERVDEKAGALMLWPLLLLGVASLVLWRVTGDLRLYAWVVFFPLIALPVIFWLYPKGRGTANWLYAAGFYVVSKIFELLDAPVFSLGHVVSGHTLKHLFAAVTCFMILRNFQNRD